jgi:RNA polymerase sigma factor (sigma-70 family)
MKKTNNSPAISLNALVPKRTKNYTLNIEPRISESSSVIYGMEKDSIAYLSDYIKNHPRMKDAEMHRLACKYFYLKQQYLHLKERLDNVDEKLTQPNDLITTGLLTAEKEELSYLLELIPYKAVFSELEETLVAHNLRLILKIANGYSGKGMSVDDLIQEGVFGFMYAIDRYDPNKNVKLGTYATWWIKQKITRALSNKARLIRLPVHLTIDITKVLGAIRKHNIPYSNKNINKLSHLTKMKESNVSHAFSYIYSYTPYNQIALYNNDQAFSEDPMTLIVDKEKKDEHIESINLNLDQKTFCSNFSYVIEKLNTLEKEFIYRKYGIQGYTEHTPIEIREWLKTVNIKQPIFFKKNVLMKIATEILK